MTCTCAVAKDSPVAKPVPAPVAKPAEPVLTPTPSGRCFKCIDVVYGDIVSVIAAPASQSVAKPAPAKVSPDAKVASAAPPTQPPASFGTAGNSGMID